MALDPDTLVSAMTFSARHHVGQTMPGPDALPYLLHLGSVAMEVVAALSAEPAEDGELSVLCAILHDTIEDTDATWSSVEAAFGAQVAHGVAALSKNPDLSKAEQMPDSLARIRARSHAVWKVKLADRICNLQPPPAHWSRDKCAGYLTQAGEILDQLGPSSPVLAERLRLRMAEYSVHWPA